MQGDTLVDEEETWSYRDVIWPAIAENDVARMCVYGGSCKENKNYKDTGNNQQKVTPDIFDI